MSIKDDLARLKTSAQNAEGERAAIEQQAYERAIRELTPLMAKIAEEAAAQREQEQLKVSADLEAFRAQVTIHAAAAEIRRMKVSASKGLCWQCHERPLSLTSPYRRCDVCDASHAR